MKAAYEELEKVEYSTSLEKSNVLMRIKDALTYENGCVILPESISIYPRNLVYFWWITLTVALFFGVPIVNQIYLDIVFHLLYGYVLHLNINIFHTSSNIIFKELIIC